jgi:hypothetical protein
MSFCYVKWKSLPDDALFVLNMAGQKKGTFMVEHFSEYLTYKPLGETHCRLPSKLNLTQFYDQVNKLKNLTFQGPITIRFSKYDRNMADKFVYFGTTNAQMANIQFPRRSYLKDHTGVTGLDANSNMIMQEWVKSYTVKQNPVYTGPQKGAGFEKPLCLPKPLPPPPKHAVAPFPNVRSPNFDPGFKRVPTSKVPPPQNGKGLLPTPIKYPKAVPSPRVLVPQLEKSSPTLPHRRGRHIPEPSTQQSEPKEEDFLYERETGVYRGRIV